MLSARAIYHEILADEGTCALFFSVVSSGEAQGGWENERIAALTEDPVLRPKIARHGLDEEKHSRLFDSLLRRRGLEAVPVPSEANYTLLLERAGIGLSHERLSEERPLTDEELLRYLVHSRVTEQRAAEEVATQVRTFADQPDLTKALRVISEDEENHLAYCHEELLRFSEQGHGDTIRRMLAEYARVEIATYRRVSLVIMGRMGEALGWSWLKRFVLRLGIHAVWSYERLWGWRRMARLEPPACPNAMGPHPGRAEAA